MTATQFKKQLKEWLNPKTWLQPKNVLFLVIGGAIVFLVNLGQKAIELRIEKQHQSITLGVEYSPLKLLAGSEIAAFCDTNDIKIFARNLDDDILTNYFIARFTLLNLSGNPTERLAFNIDMGCNYAKIVDVQYVVRSPTTKRILLKHNLPPWQWALPTNLIPATVTVSHEADVGVNVYCSLNSGSGYGAIASTSAERIELQFLPTAPVNTWYIVASVENATAEVFGDDVLALPNPTLQYPSFYPILDKNHESNAVPAEFLRKQDLAFLEGRVAITCENGFDPDTRVEVFVLAKAASGQKVNPSVKLEGAPRIAFKELNAPHSRTMPPLEQLDSKRIAAGLKSARGIVVNGKVLLAWQPLAASNYAGVKIYRSKGRPIGDFSEIGDKIYEGTGVEGLAEVELQTSQRVDEMKPDQKNPATFLTRVPTEPATNSSPALTNRTTPTRSKIPIPLNIRVIGQVEGLQFVDSPPSGIGTVTYTFYARDNTGVPSYPVVVNVNTAEKPVHSRYVIRSP
jgi:hypothetical protein